jgi:hypothetical protein
VSVARFAFQACSIDHSDISPFRINNLRTRHDQDSADCDRSSNGPRSLTGFSSIAATLLLPQRNDRRASILLNRNVETASKSGCVTVCPYEAASVPVRVAPTTRDFVREAWTRAPPSKRRSTVVREPANLRGLAPARARLGSTAVDLRERHFEPRSLRHDPMIHVVPQGDQ